MTNENGEKVINKGRFSLFMFPFDVARNSEKTCNIKSILNMRIEIKALRKTIDLKT